MKSKPLNSPIFARCALVSALSFAVVQQAMAQTSDTISVAPFVGYFTPFVVAVANALIALLIGWAATLYQRMTNMRISQAALETATSWAQTHAGAAILADSNNLAAVQLRTSSPLVQDIATQMGNAIPKVLAAAGVTPEGVALLVAGELGKLQASMTSAPAPAAPLKAYQPSVLAKDAP